jgi:NAD(P)-dependent dehydrogenase (short-subunit alcohol dehydrogenase family)
MNAGAGSRYLITGGTNGIGRYVAEHLTRSGADVWITGTRDESVAAALAAGVARGGSVCDAASADQTDTAFREAVRFLGPLSGVFANAGIDGQAGPAATLDLNAVRRLFDVNVIGVLLTAQAAYEHLERPGSIVINASVNAMRPERGFADYNASKAAAASLAQSLAVEWGPEEITVTAVCPGYFRSNMTGAWMDDPEVRDELLSRIPMGRFGRAEEIGATVAFLLSPAARFLSGSLIPIAGASNV